MNKNLLSYVFILTGIFYYFPAKSVDWPEVGNLVNNNVINTDIDIKDNCIINGGGTGQIAVAATGGNSTVTITPIANKWTLAGRAAGESDLYFYAEEPTDTILFNLENYGLDFEGGQTDLLITFSGKGQMIFQLGNGISVRFTYNAATNSGGTRFMVRMGQDNGPKVNFIRTDNASDLDTTIVIGAKSVLSYLSTDTTLETQNADISFFPANSIANTGRMILKIEDTGAVYIGGNSVADIPDPRLADIDMTTPAGGLASFRIINDNGSNFFAGLLVLNYNTELTDLLIDPWFAGAFTGIRRGFILGANARLRVQDEAYLDYVGLTNNICPDPNIPDHILAERSVSSVVKKRNASAFIVDGNPVDVFPSPNPNVRSARITCQDDSGLYFRSGVDKHGAINDMHLSFTVGKKEQTPGEGEIVFDIEGRLKVEGQEPDQGSAIQLLSLEVTPAGGSLLIDSSKTNFPLRTFHKDENGEYVSYNKSAILINNDMILEQTYLVHTDANHTVCENNDSISEPTYIGGESFALDPEGQWPHPKIVFRDSFLWLHTSVAFTGVDLFVPNWEERFEEPGNETLFTCFGNGYKKDKGSGRNMILGTQIGSTACNGCTIISQDAHLNIFQDREQEESNLHILRLTTSCNNDKIWDDLQFVCGPCQDEPSIHTIYLGNASNISIGSENQLWNPATNPTLSIEGNYFSFATRGGLQCCPELSAVTGQGGIFVDQYGVITIDRCFRANVSTMVVQSGNGEIDLPPSNVFFNNKVGITKAPLDLATDTIIVDKGEKISDYTINWLELEKDYGTFCPYVAPCVPECYCPVITTSNLENVPTVKGEVGQLQIQGSRFANPVHVKADGGHIREFVFVPSCNSGEASAAVIIVTNDAEVGLGSAHVNKDSLNASVVLGINGITIIAEAGEGDVDNDGRINLNQDIEINNMCHILTGPKFGT